MSDLENLQDIISQIVLRVLQERGVNLPTSNGVGQSLARSAGNGALAPTRGRILVAVCCDECLSDPARAALDELKAAHFELMQPAEEELKKRAPREQLVAAHDLVLLPAVGDDDAAKMALGLFDEPVARTALAALASGKPLVAALHKPYEEALKTRSPLLKRMFDGHQRALQGYGFEIVSANQLATVISSRYGAPSSALPNGSSASNGSNGKKQLITAQDIDRYARSGQPLSLPPGALITPLARDRARELGLNIE